MGQTAAILGLFVLALAACFPGLFAGFIWDDRILAGAEVLQEWSGLWDIWFSIGAIPLEDHYRPVHYTSYWLEYKLWGLSAFSSHLINILLHAANALLLWRLLLRCGVPGAWLTAAVFAVHPLHTETVAFITGRKDLLVALFYLWAAHVWLGLYRGASNTEAQPTIRHHVLLGVLLLLGMWSKTIMVTLPGGLLLLHWWQQGRVTRQTLLQLTPLAVLALLLILFDLYTHRAGTRNIPLDYSLWERVLIAAQSLCFYLGKLLWPTQLIGIYPHWNIGAARSWLSLLAVLLMALLLWRYCRLGKPGRGAAAAMLFFVMALFLTLGFVNFGHMTVTFVSDRYAYLASIGPLALGVAAVVRLARATSGRLAPQAMPRMTALGVALGLGALTWMSAEHTRLYQDEVRLLRHILAHNPRAGGVRTDLGYALYRRGQLQEALEVTQQSLALRDDPRGTEQMMKVLHQRAGMILLRLGQHEQARGHLQEALENPWGILWGVQWEGIDRNVFLGYQKAAEQALGEGLHEAAVILLQLLTEARPKWPQPWADLGEALLATGQYTEAITALEQAIALDPELTTTPAIHVFIARAAAALEQTERATQHYTQALALDPDFLPALKHLGQLQFTLGNHSQALNAWQRLVALAPDNAEVHSTLGDVLIALGQPEAARRSLQQALALDPTLASARTRLRKLNTDSR